MNARKKATEPAEPRYADLVEELERILEELENDEIDVDELAARVQRGSELIRTCRERLVNSRARIEQVVADLEALDPAAGDPERDATDQDEG